MKEVNETYLTPWFDGQKHKPERPGVYMLRDGGRYNVGYQRWDGRRWFLWCRTIAAAAQQADEAASCYQNDDWRGLRKEPK